MGKRAMRVILASDQPQVRRYLGRVAEQNFGGVVVGEGDNAIKAMRLAWRLRPDMAIIDSYLPHNMGLNGVALSWNAGLDAAQAISAAIPDVRVVLVNNAVAADLAYNSGVEAVLTRQSPAESGQTISHFDTGPGVTFASIQTRPLPDKGGGFADKSITVGICGLLLGLILTGTMILAYVGLPLMIIGAVSLGVGFIGRLIGSRHQKDYHSDIVTEHASSGHRDVASLGG